MPLVFASSENFIAVQMLSPLLKLQRDRFFTRSAIHPCDVEEKWALLYHGFVMWVRGVYRGYFITMEMKFKRSIYGTQKLIRTATYVDDTWGMAVLIGPFWLCRTSRIGKLAGWSETKVSRSTTCCQSTIVGRSRNSPFGCW